MKRILGLLMLLFSLQAFAGAANVIEEDDIDVTLEEGDADNTDKKDDFMVAPNQLALGGCSAYLDSDREQPVAKALINFNQDGNGTNKQIGRPAIVHGGQVNIFFFDGHSESLTKDALYRKKYYTRVEGADDRDAAPVAHSVTSDKWILDPDQD